MSNVGFKGFRKPETIAADAYALALKRIGPEGRYIYWTGSSYHGRAQSLRSQALRCADRKNVPIPFKTWLAKVVKAVSENVGFNAERAVEGLYLHAGAKPCVYIELSKDKDGNYIAVRDCPYADPGRFPKGIKKGDMIVSAKEKPMPKGKAAPAQVEQPAEMTL